MFGQIRMEPVIYGVLCPTAHAVNEINLGLFVKGGGDHAAISEQLPAGGDFHDAIRQKLRDMRVAPRVRSAAAARGGAGAARRAASAGR